MSEGCDRMDQELVWINGVNTGNKVDLVEWTRKTKTNLVQVNGQRKYGGPPPDWIGEAPGNGSEVYIGKIPQHIYENKLIPLFQSIGRLYEFRLMMTFSGLNRGFAYARYADRAKADAAITALNGYEIDSGQKIVVYKSTEKCQLMLRGLPDSVDQTTLKKLIQGKTLGVEDLLIYQNPARETEKMAAVKYISHTAAAMAKKKICEDPQLLSGYLLTVEWLKSEVKYGLRAERLQSKSSAPLPLERRGAIKGVRNTSTRFGSRPPINAVSQQRGVPESAFTKHVSGGTSSTTSLKYGQPENRMLNQSASPDPCNPRQDEHGMTRHHRTRSDDVWKTAQCMEELLLLLFEILYKILSQRKCHKGTGIQLVAITGDRDMENMVLELRMVDIWKREFPFPHQDPNPVSFPASQSSPVAPVSLLIALG
ncbi:dead end protein homolog 1-like [Pelodytes ibericus]